jgi:hypothetical protein
MSIDPGERECDRARLRLIVIDERHATAHRQRIASDEMGRVECATASAEVEVMHRELLGTLHRMRRRHRVEAEQVVRVDAGRVARVHARRGRRQRSARGGIPGLARVRVEPGLEERLARARLVGHRREDTLHTGACGGCADARQEAEGAIRAAGLGQRREHEDDPLRPPPVVHERDAAQLTAVFLEVHAQAPVEPEQAADQTAPSADRATGERHRQRGGDDALARSQR